MVHTTAITMHTAAAAAAGTCDTHSQTHKFVFEFYLNLGSMGKMCADVLLRLSGVLLRHIWYRQFVRETVRQRESLPVGLPVFGNLWCQNMNKLNGVNVQCTHTRSWWRGECWWNAAAYFVITIPQTQCYGNGMKAKRKQQRSQRFGLHAWASEIV